MPPKGKYSDPKLRDKVKEEIHNSDKGGEPGQWSARKAQLMAAEYKRRGGGYTTDKESGQDESQKNLEKWTEEEWQTEDGSGDAKQSDGTRKRYLPKKAWEQMSEKEKEETDQVKQQESQKGKQFVGNTSKAKKARQQANEEEEEEFEGRKANSSKTRSSSKAGAKADEDDDEDKDKESEQPDDDQETGSKRGRASKNGSGAGAQNKKQKTNGKSKSSGDTVGSKHDDAEEDHGPRGSSDRLPKKGQSVTWKSLPGFVHGKVLEVVTSNKTVKGKSIKASKSDPKVALEANSGKFCVHKPDAMFYE